MDEKAICIVKESIAKCSQLVRVTRSVVVESLLLLSRIRCGQAQDERDKAKTLRNEIERYRVHGKN